MDGLDTFDSPLLADVQINSDGTLKPSGKQNIRFYTKKFLKFRAKPKLDESGVQMKDEKGKPLFEIDPKTGLPFKIAYEENVEMVRVETKGDTNIKDDVADEFIKRQYFRQYKFFKEGRFPDGHPIEDFDFIQAPTILELHLLGIHTIEQIAAASDLVCGQLKDQSGYEIRDIAAQWIQINSPQGQNVKAAALERELLQAKREIEALKARSPRDIPRIVEQRPADVAQVSEDKFMEIPVKRKGGRPKKNVQIEG